ncbi:hypothetical protein [Pseudomonas phage LKA1]|uniref:Uncharacterized protein n=1 Tax=Pseudomonas phage LKA1 TaxID=386793 RepID=Q0E611_9CAUD|nr:hypothetical protein AV952_gp03 [Pseudomonas phage LKA1]CAK24971.1 hypothetical protein [Pseudomonas phage LKA1]
MIANCLSQHPCSAEVRHGALTPCRAYELYKARRRAYHFSITPFINWLMWRFHYKTVRPAAQ